MNKESTVRLSSALAGVVLIYALAPTCLGADWPQWRGPDRNGISVETDWSIEGNGETLWQTSAGLGYSAVSIAGGLLYTMGFDPDSGEDVIYCLDAETGDEFWSHAYPCDIMNKGHEGGTLATPVVDGACVYTKNRVGKLICFDAEGGDVLWSRDLMKEYDAKLGIWGYSSSPLIVGDLVIIDAGISFAFSKEDGELVWKTKDYGQGYATPIDFELDGEKLVACLNATGLVILGLEDGKERYVHEFKAFNDINAATPIVIGDRVFITSNAGCAMLKMGGEKLEVLWESKKMRAPMNGPVLVDDHLYGFDGKMLKCLDLDGNEKWRHRGLGQGSLIVADNKLIVLSDDGKLLIAEVSSEAFEPMHEETVFEPSEAVCWTMPILVEGRIYCRDNRGKLVCLDHRGEG